MTERPELCFDPCFRGSRSSGSPTASPTSNWRRFRSLFSWITLLGFDTRPRACAVDGTVSILVFVDHAPRAVSDGRTHVDDGVSILVFVDHAPRGGLPSLSCPSLICFDPCFRGSRSSGLPLAKTTCLLVSFRSLFSWITLLGNPIGVIRMFALIRFRSLFSWITLLGYTPRELTGFDADGFRSLFSWITLLGWN